jgi:putative redox protein
MIEGTMQVASDSNGTSIVVGHSPDSGLGWAGIRAADLLLISAAACAAHDVIEILKKQRQPLEELKVTCSGDQLPDPPYTFTRIHLHYMVRGAVKRSSLEKAIDLSENKYCSVISTLRPGVPVSSDYEISS